MGRAKQIQRHQAYALQNVHWWGLENVAHTTFTVAEVLTVQEFNKQWRRFSSKVLTPATDGRWMRFMELQRRGAPHAHVIHYWQSVREGCDYQKHQGWRSKGPALRECIECVDACRKYGFGWNKTEPLRGTDTANMSALVNYLLKYANKSRYMGQDTAFEGCRLVSFGQGCIERHGCLVKYEPWDLEHPIKWIKGGPATYEVVKDSLDRDKREMVRLFCYDNNIEMDQISCIAEVTYHWMHPRLALRELWRNEIIPKWKHAQVYPF
jgi:hypothetical protein